MRERDVLSPPPSDIGTGLSGLSCPSLRLCVAIDADGNVLSTHTPEIPDSWRRAAVDHVGTPQAISCPSRSFCLVTDSYGDVIISTNPTGASPRGARIRSSTARPGATGRRLA